MLREIPETRQIRGEPRRRWFNSDAMDLYVWYDNEDAPLGFQLCYGKPSAVSAQFARFGADLPEDVRGLVAAQIDAFPQEPLHNVSAPF